MENFLHLLDVLGTAFLFLGGMSYILADSMYDAKLTRFSEALPPIIMVILTIIIAIFSFINFRDKEAAAIGSMAVLIVSLSWIIFSQNRYGERKKKFNSLTLEQKENGERGYKRFGAVFVSVGSSLMFISSFFSFMR